MRCDLLIDTGGTWLKLITNAEISITGVDEMTGDVIRYEVAVSSPDSITYIKNRHGILEKE